MGIAGLWGGWLAPGCGVVLSSIILTISATSNPLMQHLHKPQDEERMVVILKEGDYDAWLNATPASNAPDIANLPLP